MKEHSNDISGKRVLITGGTTGIGRATARLLARKGAKVFICGRHERELRDALQEIGAESDRIGGTLADVSNSADVARLFEEALESLGGLDILVNNAAIAGGGVEDEERWRYVVDTNLSGYIDGAVHAVRHLKNQSGRRHIVLIGSMSADVMEEGSSIYVATKRAIQGFAAAFRKEVNPYGIHVNLIEPGRTQSDMSGGTEEEEEAKIKEGRLLLSEDVAEAVLYVVTQPERCSIVDLKMRPLQQLI